MGQKKNMNQFRCEKCGCVENAQLCNYWKRRHPGKGNPPQPLLCSECDPDIGKWHGLFPKKPAKGMNIGADGFLYDRNERGVTTVISGKAR